MVLQGRHSLFFIDKNVFWTGAWIITGGSHAGVMKQVGEAVRDFCMGSTNKNSKIINIGIVTWGIVHNRKSLISTTVSTWT